MREVYILCHLTRRASLPQPPPLERYRGIFQRRLGEHASPVFSLPELRSILAELSAELDLPRRISMTGFVSFLEARCNVRRVDFTPENTSKDGNPYKTITKYVYGQASPYTLGLSLRPNAYLTHATAVFLHAFSEQLPKTIYVNKEQTPKPPPLGPLTQQGIDRAFAGRARVTQFVFTAEDHRYVLLNGKNTGRLEVSKHLGPQGELLDSTKLERTLIDIVVRPSYAGGPFEVLEAYRRAKEKASIGVFLATLRKLDYAYPYHQAIGFYMDRAGYRREQLARVKEAGLSFDFYLANAMKNPAFDSTWRIYHPPGL